MSKQPPSGVPPLPEPSAEALAAALGGNPIPPPETKITRYKPESAPAPHPGTTPAADAPPVSAPSVDPLAKLSGTFAAPRIAHAAETALNQARTYLANVVTSIHHANTAITEILPILEENKADLKKLHNFDLKEATDFLKKAKALTD